jgi:hypothetical protein
VYQLGGFPVSGLVGLALSFFTILRAAWRTRLTLLMLGWLPIVLLLIGLAVLRLARLLLRGLLSRLLIAVRLFVCHELSLLKLVFRNVLKISCRKTSLRPPPKTCPASRRSIRNGFGEECARLVGSGCFFSK